MKRDFRTDPATGTRVWRGTWLYVLELPAGPDGRRRQEKRRGFATKAAAEAAFDEARDRLRDQASRVAVEPVPVPAAATAPGLTVAGYVDRWLEEIRPTLAVTAWANYRAVMHSYVVPWIGTRVLVEITEDDLSALYRDLLARGSHRRCKQCVPADCCVGQPLSAATVRTVHRILHKAFFDARKLVPVNPATGARRPKRAPRAINVWTEEELARNLRALSGDRLYAAWFLGLSCGLRRGELAGLRWIDIDLDRGTLRVQRQRTTADWDVVEKEPKGTSRRTVVIGPATVQVLAAHRERQKAEYREVGQDWMQSGYVFVTEAGEPFHPAALTRLFQATCRRVDARVIRLHETRHTCATLALAANVHPKVVQERLGHSSIQVTLDTYSHTLPSMQQDAATAIESFLSGTQTTDPRDEESMP